MKIKQRAPARPAEVPFRPSGADRWSAERLATLSMADVKQLRVNAERLGETELVALCDEALTNARKAQSAARRAARPVRAR